MQRAEGSPKPDGRQTPSPEPTLNPNSEPLPKSPFSYTHLTKEAYAALETQAIAAAKQVKKRYFKLTGFKNPDKPRLLFIGCQGDGREAQAAVAKHMNEIAEMEQPDLIICSGDIVYDNGVTSPLDDAFNKCFHIPYALKTLKKIKWVLTPGNHDANMHSLASLNYNYRGKAAIERMVGHSYLPNGEKPNHSTVDDMVKIIKQDTIDISDLNQFNMLQDYAEYDLGPATIFCVDSNFIVKDFLRYIKNEDDVQNRTDIENQLKWLIERIELARQAGKEIFITQHHSPKTPGKRSGPEGHFDSKHYLTEAELIEACHLLGVKTRSYNELIYALYQKYQILNPTKKIIPTADDDAPKAPINVPVKVIAAHDHFISVDDNPLFFQLITGGGGGDLQSCMSLKDHPDMKLHLRRHGFAVYQDGILDIHTTSKENLVMDPKNTEYNIQRHLCYDTKKHAFALQDHPDDRVNVLRKLILELCEDSLDALKKLEDGKMKSLVQQKEAQEQAQKASTGIGGFLWSYAATTYKAAAQAVSHVTKSKYDADAEERFCINDMKAFFLQYKLVDYKVCLEYLREVKKKFEEIESKRNKQQPAVNKFSKELDILFQQRLQETLESIYDSITTPIVRNVIGLSM